MVNPPLDEVRDGAARRYKQSHAGHHLPCAHRLAIRCCWTGLAHAPQKPPPPATVRQRRVRRLPRMRHPGPRLRAIALRRLRPRHRARAQKIVSSTRRCLPQLRSPLAMTIDGPSAMPRFPGCLHAQHGQWTEQLSFIVLDSAVLTGRRAFFYPWREVECCTAN